MSKSLTEIAKVSMNTTFIKAAKEGNIKTIEELLSSGDVDIDFLDMSNDEIISFVDSDETSCITFLKFTALHWSIWKGHTKIAKLLIEKGADIHKSTENKQTALHLAARKNNIEVIKILIEKKSDLDAVSDCGRQSQVVHELYPAVLKFTALHWSICNGHTETAKLLIERRADIHKRTTDGRTALHLAAQANRIEIIHLLMEKKADLNVKSDYGGMLQTALSDVQFDKNIEAITLLIDLGADIHAVDKYGRTVLYQTYRANDMTSEIFIKKGSDIAKRDSDGMTPLLFAAHNRSIFLAKQLIESGADINAQDNDGDTALHLLFFQDSGFEREYYVDFVNMLFKSGINIHAKNHQGMSVMDSLVAYNQIDFAEMLLVYGAVIPVLKSKVICAAQMLMMLAEGDKFDKNQVDQMLADLEFDLEFDDSFQAADENDVCYACNGTRGEDGNTALHLALTNNPDLASELILRNAALNIPNKLGKTAAMLAMHSPYFVTLLKIKYLKDWLKCLSKIENTSDLNAKKQSLDLKDVKTVVESLTDRANQVATMTATAGTATAGTAALATVASASASSSGLEKNQTSVKQKNEDMIHLVVFNQNVSKDVLVKEIYESIGKLQNKQKNFLSFILSELIVKNMSVFHSFLHLAYESLVEIDKDNADFKKANTYCYELLLAARSFGYQIQIKNSLNDTPLASLVRSENILDANNPEANQKLMKKYQIQHLLCSDSDQQPIVKQLMADYLEVMDSIRGIKGVTGSDASSMCALFEYTAEQSENLKAENKQLKDALAKAQKLEVKTKAKQKQTVGHKRLRTSSDTAAAAASSSSQATPNIETVPTITTFSNASKRLSGFASEPVETSLETGEKSSGIKKQKKVHVIFLS